MDKIKEVSGKLLYLVYTMSIILINIIEKQYYHQKNSLNFILYKKIKYNQEDKGLLKDLILSRSKEILKVYEDYQNNGTKLTLENKLRKLAKIERNLNIQEGKSSVSSKNYCITLPRRIIPKRY